MEVPYKSGEKEAGMPCGVVLESGDINMDSH